MPTHENSSPSEQPLSRLEEARGIIDRSEAAIEQEFARTANDWLSCVGSRLFQLDCLLSTSKAEAELGEELYHGINERLEQLKERLSILKQQYPDKEPQPPEEVKKEILVMVQRVV